MYLSDLKYDFIEYLEIERHCSIYTSRNYNLYVERFIEFSGDIKANQITKELIRKYRLWLNRYVNDYGQELSANTQALHLIALRMFLTYLQDRDIKSLDPNQIKLPKTNRNQVTFLYPDEIKKLVQVINNETIIGKRDLAIVSLLFSGGLRVSELVNLNRSQINLKKREFMVRGKRSKDRPIFISNQAALAVEQYLSARQDNLEPLFINYSKNNHYSNDGQYKRLTTRSIQRMINKYAKLAGITKKVTPHIMRHSFATDLLMNGADIRSVQEMLGHSNIATTQIYTHITNPHLKEVHQKFHDK